MKYIVSLALLFHSLFAVAPDENPINCLPFNSDGTINYNCVDIEPLPFTQYSILSGDFPNLYPYVIIETTQAINEDNTNSISYTILFVENVDISFTANPSNGTVQQVSNQIIYTPNQDYNGVDTFAISFSDEDKGILEKTVTITINPVNDIPEVTMVSNMTIDEDNFSAQSFTIFDVDGDTVVTTVSINPSNGSVTIDGSEVIYTPNANYNGTDNFALSFNDGNGEVITKNINVTVNAVNDAPVAITSSFIVNEDTSYNGSISATDVDGDTLTYSIVSNPSKGTISLKSNGTFTYTPYVDNNGADSFSFKVYDGTTYSEAETVTITINPDLDNDGIIDTEDTILRHPLIDQTNGISPHLSEVTLDLKTGWNMIPLPVDTVLRPDIADYNFTNEQNEFSDIYVDRYANLKVFGNYNIIWQYIDGKWRAYSENEEIRNLIVSNNFELITQLDKNNAFWVLMNEDRLVTFYGKSYIFDVDSYSQGWHMTKYRGNLPIDLKKSAGINLTWEYIDGTWIKDSENLKGAAWIKKTKETNSTLAIALDGVTAYFKEDYATAIDLFEEAASLGSSYAKYRLGLIYVYGHGVDKNLDTAKQYFLDSVDIVYSKHYLGYMYENGLGVEQDHSTAKQYYDEIIQDYNYSSSFNNLGNIYEYGHAGVDINYQTAFDYYEKAASMYNAQAVENLADMYALGKGVDKNISKALELYVKAANHNNRNAQWEIGRAYYDGECFNQDYLQAKKWFEKSAFMGNSDNAYNMLGILYKNGYGVTQDYLKAIEYYTKAHDLDAGDYGTTNLGHMYRNGEGVDQNYTKAVELYQIAANKGNKYGQGNLAAMYLNGYGVTQNYTKAAEYYTLAAEQGLDWAQRNLAHLYYDGNGVTQNYDTAYTWYLKAAEQGDTSAMTYVGGYYSSGTGSITENKTTSFEWYRKAAVNGNIWAQGKIGFLYYLGDGTNTDKERAYCWLKNSNDGKPNDYINTVLNDSNNWTDVSISNDCIEYLELEINTYKIEDEGKEQCTNLDILLK